MIDAFARLMGSSADVPQNMDTGTTAGRLSENWLDLQADLAASLGDGSRLSAEFLVKTTAFNSATENATVELQLVALPFVPAGTPPVLATFDFVDADVSVANNTITEAGHGLTNGTRITLTNSGGALPAGLATATSYYVIAATTNTFQVSLTPGGSAVDITAAAGGGTHTVTIHMEVLVSSGPIGVDRLHVGAKRSIAMPHHMESTGYPLNRFLFARMLPSNTLTGGQLLCDLGVVRSSRRPFHKSGFTFNPNG